MARGKKAAPVQEEILDPESGKPISESPDYDPELHALWIETLESQEATKTARDAEADVKKRAGEELHRKGIDHYAAGGADLWAEPGKEKIKAKRKGDRPKGKITQVTVGEVD